MGVPGPAGAEWAVALLGWAALTALVGELLRTVTARWVSLWRRPEPIERLVVDFYLGGALLYLLASVPWGGFVAPVVYGLPVAAAILLGWIGARSLRRPDWRDEVVASFRPLARPAYLLTLLSALGLFAVELSAALSSGTGNTFDSSLFTTYVSLLLQNHTAPLSFAPYASTGLLYPQGATVWFAGAQLAFGLPPARTALLVTPLFLGVAPLAGFAFGRRMMGTERAGLAVALLLAWVGTGTRGIVYGSNDFVLAFPLVLLLAGWAVVWLRSTLPSFTDVLAFGVVCGYSAAINPVGAEWLLLALPVAALLSGPRFAGRFLGWAVRWVTTIGAALVGVLPSLYVLAEGWSSPRFVPGATAAAPGSPTGISSAAFYGAVDPFLFGAGATGLSSVLLLRAELAILLTVGLAAFLVIRRDSAVGRYFEPLRPFVAGAVAVQVAMLGTVWWASTGFGPAVDVSRVTSASEVSIWLFAVYGLVAAVPLALALERFTGWIRRTDPVRPEGPVTNPSRRHRPVASPYRVVLPLVVALVIVVPGVVLTPTELSSDLTTTYHQFGNVTGADFDLLAYAGSHLPAGARVLVAPGSAGEFLPGYCPNIILLYPMVPGWRTVNALYELLVHDLPNATFDSADVSALSLLAVSYVVVTGNNTVLWWAFSPTPFLSRPFAYPELFHEGDAYLFAVTQPGTLPPP